MLQAILWDFGGVFTTSPFEAFNRYEAANGLPADFIRGINATNPDSNAWAKFESSEITAHQFDLAFETESRAAGHPIPGRVVIEMLSGNLRPRMVTALARCKERFKVACITNNVKAGEGASMSRTTEKAAQLQQVFAMFDLVVESSKEGVRKPDPRIYRIACERLGVAPEHALFLDDLGINLKPAKALGMRTIKVVSEAQALTDLESVTGITLS
jgi:putative hydrolase of the HAD superfamily